MGILSRIAKAIIVGPAWQNHKPLNTRVTGYSRDECGNPVTHVQANSYMDVTRDGQTPAGDVSKSAVKVGPRKWQLRVEDNDWRHRDDD